MSEGNGDGEGEGDHDSTKGKKISYKRDFMLSLSEPDICNILPPGLDSSFLPELTDDSTTESDNASDSCGRTAVRSKPARDDSKTTKSNMIRFARVCRNPDTGILRSDSSRWRNPALGTPMSDSLRWGNPDIGVLRSDFLRQPCPGTRILTSDSLMKSVAPYRPPHLYKTKLYSYGERKHADDVRESEEGKNGGSPELTSKKYYASPEDQKVNVDPAMLPKDSKDDCQQSEEAEVPLTPICGDPNPTTGLLSCPTLIDRFGGMGTGVKTDDHSLILEQPQEAEVPLTAAGDEPDSATGLLSCLTLIDRSGGMSTEAKMDNHYLSSEQSEEAEVPLTPTGDKPDSATGSLSSPTLTDRSDRMSTELTMDNHSLNPENCDVEVSELERATAVSASSVPDFLEEITPPNQSKVKFCYLPHQFFMQSNDGVNEIPSSLDLLSLLKSSNPTDDPGDEISETVDQFQLPDEDSLITLQDLTFQMEPGQVPVQNSTKGKSRKQNSQMPSATNPGGPLFPWPWSLSGYWSYGVHYFRYPANHTTTPPGHLQGPLPHIPAINNTLMNQQRLPFYFPVPLLPQQMNWTPPPHQPNNSRHNSSFNRPGK